MRPLRAEFNRCARRATRQAIGETLIAPSGSGALNPSREAREWLRYPLVRAIEPPPAGLLFRRMAMSNLCDAIGLRMTYSKAESQYQTEFEPATGTIWGYFNPRGTPCFGLGLLRDIREHDSALSANGGKVEVEGELLPARYYVCGSRVPGVFNLGGDLALFLMLIRAQDREALTSYARLCIDNMFARIQGYRASHLITISLVQGDALGGGLECALSSDVVE